MENKIWETFKNQTQWKAYLKGLIKTNDKALFKAIILIYDMQTASEKNSKQSTENNKVGFSQVDAKDLDDIAKKIKTKQQLTNAELHKARNKMQKYWKQLMQISKEKMKIKTLQNEMVQQVPRPYNDMCPCSYGICDECEKGEYYVDY